MLCPAGKIPNRKKDRGAWLHLGTGCVKPEWKTPVDCDYTSQYLDDSSADRMQHECRPCPLGGYCVGALVTYAKVRAKFGFYRMRQEEASHRPNRPPSCLMAANGTAIEPPCVFAQCIHAAACLGAPNRVLERQFLLPDSTDLAAVLDQNETCNEALGYRETCIDRITGNATRCRLCASCLPGFKRHGGGAQCKKCPEPGTNRALLGIGAFVMLIGSAVLVYLAITSEKSDEETSDAVKKIVSVGVIKIITTRRLLV